MHHWNTDVFQPHFRLRVQDAPTNKKRSCPSLGIRFPRCASGPPGCKQSRKRSRASTLADGNISLNGLQVKTTKFSWAQLISWSSCYKNMSFKNVLKLGSRSPIFRIIFGSHIEVMVRWSAAQGLNSHSFRDPQKLGDLRTGLSVHRRRMMTMMTIVMIPNVKSVS